MTLRRSKREIENALAELDESGAGETVTIDEVSKYFDRVAEEGADAPLPREYFGPESPVLNETPIAPDVNPDYLPADVSSDDLTALERFAFVYWGGNDPELRQGIFDLRRERGGRKA